MIKILLVDDHELVRMGISRILNDVEDFKVVASVGSGEEAIEYCRKNEPDIILMDVGMPGIGGLEATRKILRFCESARVICLSMHKESPIPTRIMQAGADGFVTKDADPSEMINAIYKVVSGQRYISADIVQQLAIDSTMQNHENPFEALSERELEITMMLTRGTKVSAIAASLNISSKTVNTYRYRMFEKLKVSSDVELTHLALRHKLIQTE